MLDVSMKFQNYPIKTVGEDAFYSYCILYHIWKISKIRQKYKNSPIVKTSMSSDMAQVTCLKTNIIWNNKTNLKRISKSYVMQKRWISDFAIRNKMME